MARKRSAAVVLGGLFAALAMTACGSGDPDHSEICIDKEAKRRVEDDDCRKGRAGSTFFYMPYAHGAPAVGQPVDTTKGSFTKPSTGRIAPVSRGGFGGRAGGGSGS